MSELFVGDVDIFRGSDAVDNQFRFNIIGSALLLSAPQRHPVDVYRSRIDALRSQRSEEHTSELQSPDHLVCRLLLEKKKKIHLRRLYNLKEQPESMNR